MNSEFGSVVVAGMAFLLASVAIFNGLWCLTLKRFSLAIANGVLALINLTLVYAVLFM